MALVAPRTLDSTRSHAGRRKPQSELLPLLMLRRGAVPARQLAALTRDERLELFVAHDLTPDWVSFSRRVAGTLIVTERDPLHALAYAVTAGVTEPIIVATSERQKAACRDVLAAGAAACITMPFTKSDVGRMLPVLRRRASAAQMDCTLRMLLDPISRSVRFRDQAVRLSQREFAVLHCLSSRNGRPVSAEDMLSYVWGDAPAGGADRSRQILEVYICQVRKRLDELGLEDAISTVRGFGYALARGSESAPK